MKFNIQINVGLVNLAAKYETAVESEQSMSGLCVGQPDKPAHSPLPIKMPTTCDECGPVTDKSLLKKGIKAGSTYTVIEQSDVADAKAANTAQFKDAITLLAHPTCDVESLSAPGKKLYYLTPATSAGEGQYQLVLELVKQHPELSFCGMFTPRTAAALFRITNRGDALVMEERVTSENKLKAVPLVGGAVDPNMFTMLNDLVLPQLTKPFDVPDLYADAYAKAIAELAAKADVVTIGKPDAAKPTVSSGTTDADLLAKLEALKAQVAAA